MNSQVTKTSTRIWVTFQREGVHCYPEAATNPSLADVSFLGNPHRHIFHFKVCVQVTHADRDIEFIQFKRWLESLYSDQGTLQLDHKSCEMIAEDIISSVTLKYPSIPWMRVEVSEDNENGAELEWEVYYSSV
jgi:hypothetical protein